MNSKWSFTLPNRGNNTIQSLVARAFARDITNRTQVPYFKLRQEILRRDGTCLCKMIEGEILKLGTWSGWLAGREKICPYLTTRRGRRASNHGGWGWATARGRARYRSSRRRKQGRRRKQVFTVIFSEREIQSFLIQEITSQNIIFRTIIYRDAIYGSRTRSSLRDRLKYARTHNTSQRREGGRWKCFYSQNNGSIGSRGMQGGFPMCCSSYSLPLVLCHLKCSISGKTKKEGEPRIWKNKGSRGWGHGIRARNKTRNPKRKTNSRLTPAPTVESSPWRRRASLSSDWLTESDWELFLYWKLFLFFLSKM